MLLVIFLTGVILWNLPPSKYDNIVCASQVEPGYLDFDNLPDTNFSCEGKVIGGYYADIETGCQMFHVCTIGQKSEITDIKFLCLNGTVFDQETRVCERLDEVDCSRSESFFDLNLELYGNNGGGYGIQPEDETKDSVDENCDEEYEDGENSCKMKSEKDDAAKHKDDEYSDWEEATTSTPPSPAPKVVSSTSTAAPTSTVKSTPSTSTRSQFVNTQPKFSLQPLGNNGVQTSLTTPNPGLQLLALHESFQENLNKNREAQSALRPPSAPSAVANRAPSPPPAVSTYQIQNAAATQTKPPFPPPLPNKLPNTVSNLSQKTHFPTPLATANVNRTPPTAPHAVNFKSEPPHHQQTSFYTNKQHSQRVTLKPSQPPSSSSSLSALAPPQKPALDTSILYRYNIFSTNGAGGTPTRPEPFGSSSARYNVPPSPSTTPSQTFKVESVHVNPFSHPTFTLAQTRPNSFNTKAQHFIAAKETVGDEEEEEIEEEEAEVEEDAAEPELPANHHHHHHQQQQQQSHSPPQKFSNYNLHTNFARAIPEANNKNSSGVPAAISVVQSSSSVSSSISSKPHSAISNSSSPASSSAPVKSSFSNANNNNNNNKKAGGANSFASTLLNARGTNITEINEQLTEEQPYYEEASVDYEESSHEYKDILYPATDVQKIKHR